MNLSQINMLLYLSVEEKYDVREKIGEGSYADVYVGYRKSDRKRVSLFSLVQLR